MILVTGTTGTVGGEVVTQPHAAGVPVRALPRSPATACIPDAVAWRALTENAHAGATYVLTAVGNGRFLTPLVYGRQRRSPASTAFA